MEIDVAHGYLDSLKKYPLLSADEEAFEVGVMQKVQEEGKKRPVLKEVAMRFTFDEVAFTRYMIKVK